MNQANERHIQGVTDPLAETWALLAIRENGSDPRAFVLRNAGQHGRSQRHDIRQVAQVHVDSEDIDLSVITARREGMYDRLPEALFHEAGSARQLKPNQAEDRNAESARQFFLPFEQEPFRLRLAMLAEEMESALNEGTKSRDQALARLWDLPDDLDPRTRMDLVRILPWMEQLSGNLGLCADCFRAVIGFPVSITITNRPRSHGPVSLASQAALGEAPLGHVVGGSDFEDGWPGIEVAVSDVPLDVLSEPARRRALRRTLEVLANYLLPVHLEVHFSMTVPADDEDSVIGDPTRPGILAMNLRL